MDEKVDHRTETMAMYGGRLRTGVGVPAISFSAADDRRCD